MRCANQRKAQTDWATDSNLAAGGRESGARARDGEHNGTCVFARATATVVAAAACGRDAQRGVGRRGAGGGDVHVGLWRTERVCNGCMGRLGAQDAHAQARRGALCCDLRAERGAGVQVLRGWQLVRWVCAHGRDRRALTRRAQAVQSIADDADGRAWEH